METFFSHIHANFFGLVGSWMRVYYDIQDLAEQIEICELVQARKDQPAAHSLDDILAEVCLNRDDLDGYTD